MTPQMDAFLAAEDAKPRRHESEHRYSLAEFGLDDREIRARLAPLFDRFHWEDTIGENAGDVGSERVG
jgi:hypothetical protein